MNVWLFLVMVSISSFASESGAETFNFRPSLHCESGLAKIKNANDLSLVLDDYSRNKHGFEVVRKVPLHIRLSPELLAQEPTDVKNYYVKRAVVEGVLRVFSFTEQNSVTISSYPYERANLTAKTGEFMPVPSYNLTVTRSKVLQALKRAIPVSSFSDLYLKNSVCSYSPITDQILYDDQGGVGISVFLESLKK